ncbi:MAG: HAMP domain-containing protein [Alphaproteobacteria bacterium]|nr:HAMP domain-containing protein [Alphaproteobacteria bacterium]
MRRPLFLKLFLSVCLSFIVVSYFVWLADALLSQSPSRSTSVQAETALAGARTAIRIGGEAAFAEEFKSWPATAREYLTVRPIPVGTEPPHDPVHGIYSTVAVDPRGQRYALIYHVTRFNGYVSPPLPLDLGPHTFYSGLIGVFIFSALLTLFMIVPIRRIRTAFGRLAAGDLKVRLGHAWLRRQDEITDLAADFNRMASRLEELVGSRDRLLADISHELRSPLARLHLAIALARQSPEKEAQSLERIGKEADKLEEMVGELLTLSKIESGATTSDEYFFVSEVSRLVADDARFEAQGKGVDIQFVADAEHPGQEALIVGSGKLVSRAIENIVRNALRFSRRGETIILEMQSRSDGTMLTIRDQGPGVKPEQLASLFDPFYRGDPGNGHGYGLGLAIAKRAILAHGGTITASNGAEEGLSITIWLPAAPNSPEGGDAIRSGWDRSVSPHPVQAS